MLFFWPPNPVSHSTVVTDRPNALRSLLATGLLVGLLVLVYLPGLRGDFAFDDYRTIVENPSLELHSLHPDALLDAAMSGIGTGPLARPLAMLSFAANRSLTGLAPWPYKATNLAIHALNALLVWALVGRLLTHLAPTAPRGAAWLIAALWALHPINLTSVLYVVQRMTSLSATFMLLTLLVYTGCRQRQLRMQEVARAWPLACLFLAVLALLCKEAALSLPFYLLLIELCVRAPTRRPLSNTARALFSGMALLVLCVGVWYFLRDIAPGYRGREFSLAERLWSEARVMFAYLRLLLVPAPGAFALFHDDMVLSRAWLTPPTTLLAVLGLLVLSVLVYRRRTQQPYLAFGWGWFLLGHALESTVIPLELMHEHRNYLPGLGIVVALTLAMGDLLVGASRARFLRLCALLALALLAGVTWSRAALWADPLLQIETELAHHPLSPRLWYEAGRLRIKHAAGDSTREAAGQAALARAAALAPIKTLPLSALLKTAIEREDGTAIAGLIPVIVAEPRETVGEEVFRDLVICQGYGQCRRDTQTVQRLGDALLARPGLSNTCRQRILEWQAVFYARMLADAAAAIIILEDLVAARPHDGGLKTRLAEALASAGQTTQAVRLAREVQASLPWSSVFTARPLRRRLARLLAHDHAG